MQTADIARRYLDYFGERDHTIVPSASLISDDPSILFTIAGMVPFIPYLTGVVPAPYARAADVQKCIRTNDIEEVGKTARHGTFFQMLGNWSFGDYFKEGAIAYAWELLTSPESRGGLGFDEKDLWVTVYEDDDEAEALWRRIAGLPAHRIQRLGREDNYWSTGQPGPAGPCSEIYFDRGPRYGADGGPAVDDNRFTEIWNLVFMQDLIEDVRGKTEFTIAGELPKKNIDTGMGLERVAFLKQGVENMYEIDQVRPVLDRAAELSGRRYGAAHEDDVRMRIVADHVRSSLMLIGDGVTPSNEGRGYILRRLLRRTVRSMRLLGVQEATFPELFPASRDAMRDAYPELAADFGRIARAAYAEEEVFLRTLVGGTQILDLAVADTKSAGGASVAGDTAFLLHDTYGFPIDLTLEIAEEQGLTVDRGAFDTLMAEQRARAKADAKTKKRALADLGVYRDFRALGETVFTGYTELEAPTRVLGIIVDGTAVPTAVAGQEAELVLAETSLYAESGGQEADQGEIVGDGSRATVLDVQRPVPGLVSHRVRIDEGAIALDDAVTTVVDRNYRHSAAQAHTATHVMGAALRQLLGQDAHQSGSLNRAGYLRYDFAWNQGLSAETRSELEEVANGALSADYEIETRVLPLAEARALGAQALFGEKYGERVRVVEFNGDWSRELCGGTHVASTAQVGLINLTSESSVGASNRRVEALVGMDAFQRFATERAILTRMAGEWRVPVDQLPDRVAELAEQLKSAERTIAEYRAKSLGERIPALIDAATVRGGVRVVAASLGAVPAADDLRTVATDARARLGSEPAVIALAGDVDGKPAVVVATNEAARGVGAKAGALAKLAAGVLGGGGGGRDDFAQGGGTDPTKIQQALDAVVAAIAG